MKISTRLLLLFLLVAVLPLALLSYFNLQQDEVMLRAEALGRMSALADKKVIQVKSYLADREGNVRIRARGPQVIEAIGIIPRVYVAGRHNAAYIREDAKIRQYFERYVEETGLFYDVFLITPQGEIVYTQKHESDFASNVITGPYRDTQLAQAFRNVSMTLEPVISGYEYYAPSQASALFIAAPIMVDGKLKGVFAVQLDNQLFYRVATDATGMGSSGEATFAQRDGDGALYTTPLKYRPDAAMKFRLSLSELKSFPTASALVGNSGSGTGPDYRGKEVVAAWRYLPELDWGMVVKVDADEVFASIYQQRAVMLEVLLGLLLFAGLLAYYFGRQISAPLEGLVRTANEVAEGELGKRADESAPGELGLFARAFNHMTENLQALYRTLEDRIEERTRELNVTNEQLQEEIIERKQAALELARAYAENKWLQRFIDLTPDIAYSIGLDGCLQHWSPALEQFCGLTPDEMKGRSCLEFICDQDKPVVEADVQKVFANGFYANIYRFIRSDGALIPFHCNGTAIYNEHGEPDGFVGLGRDISELLSIEEKLRESEERWKFALEGAGDGVWDWNIQTGEALYSKRWKEMFGFAESEIGNTFSEWANRVHPEDMPGVMAAIHAHTDGKTPSAVIEFRMLCKDGNWGWTLCRGMLVSRDTDGKPLRLVGTNTDITERKKTEEQLRVAAATFDTHDAIVITDANANIIRVNQAFQDITGYSPKDVLGKNPRIMSSGRQDKAFYAVMWQQLLNTGSWAGEMWDRRKSGQIYPKWLTITVVKNEQGETTEYVGIFSDITARKQAEEQIYNLAFYDALTKLPNRRLLLDRFHSALSLSARSNLYGSVLFLDMDKFKTLNDTLGHDYGDMMLIEVAQRIKSCVRGVDTVARMGGDEFVVLIEEISANSEETSQKVAVIAEKIRKVLNVPYQIKGRTHHSSPSIGISTYRGTEDSIDDLLKYADIAMYQAKESGRNNVRFFDPLIQQAVEMHAELETDLHSAILDHKLHLYYQIQMDNHNRPLGAEALLRWTHPKRGMVSPSQFIPVAEKSSLILDIGNWVIDTACRQLALWSKQEQTRDLVLAVNVSAQQFRLHDFVDRIAAVVRAHQVDPSRLKLELTEGVVLNDVADVVKKMNALKALGVKLSMDDFGTGYSSLSYLKQLPLDQIKIDQSFVRDIATDPSDAVMVQAVIGIAQNFRLNVIAEGVETEAQLNFLKQNGCMAYQGDLFSKPMPIEEFEVLLGIGKS